MKLRFRGSSLRLRVNRKEVESLASGVTLKEQLLFPGENIFRYVLEPTDGINPEATFEKGTIRVRAPKLQIVHWAGSADVGLYFELDASGSTLKIAIEKDLECIDGPIEERDPDAYARADAKSC